MKQVYAAHTILEAHIVAGLLEQHEIHCHISGHFLQGAIGELPAGDFATISVADEDVAVAEKMISDYEAGLFKLADTD